MQEHDAMVTRWLTAPPRDANAATYCIREVYRSAPSFFTLDCERKHRLLLLRDALFHALCENYLAFAKRYRVQDHGTGTLAMSMFTVCAVLSLAGEGRAVFETRASDEARRMGLVCVLQIKTLKDALSSVWLLNERWMELDVLSDKARLLPALSVHIEWLVRHAFYFVQTRLEESEVGEGVSEALFFNGETTSATIRRFVEGLCRPLALLRLLAQFECEPGRAPSTTRRNEMAHFFARCSKELENIDTFRAELRDFLENATVVGLDYALFTEKERLAHYVPYLMLMMARPPEMLSVRASFIECALLSRMGLLGDEEKHGRYTFTERMAAVAVKLTSVHSLMQPLGVSLIGDYTVMEPFAIDKLCERIDEPVIVILFGETHVIFEKKLFLCQGGATQALSMWIDIVIEKLAGKLGGVDVREALARVFREDATGAEKKRMDSWNTQISF